jgi:hypothetical protein
VNFFKKEGKMEEGNNRRGNEPKLKNEKKGR